MTNWVIWIGVLVVLFMVVYKKRQEILVFFADLLESLLKGDIQ